MQKCSTMKIEFSYVFASGSSFGTSIYRTISATCLSDYRNISSIVRQCTRIHMIETNLNQTYLKAAYFLIRIFNYKSLRYLLITFLCLSNHPPISNAFRSRSNNAPLFTIYTSIIYLQTMLGLRNAKICLSSLLIASKYLQTLNIVTPQS